MENLLNCMASKIYGDIKALKRLATSLDKNVVREVKRCMKEQAQEIKEDIQTSIKSQKGNWKPLDSDTIKAKGHNKILLDTGQLVDSITVTENGDNYVVSPTGTHTGGISNSDLAKLHEYGTENMPPRPIFRPVYNEYEKIVPEEVSDVVIKEIKKFK